MDEPLSSVRDFLPHGRAFSDSLDSRMAVFAHLSRFLRFDHVSSKSLEYAHIISLAFVKMDQLLSKDKYVYYLCFLLDPQHRELSILSQPEFAELRAALPDPPLTQQQEFVQHIFKHRTDQSASLRKNATTSEQQQQQQQQEGLEDLSVEDLRSKLSKHFPIQQFLDTLEKHDMTLPELYIQDNYWLESHQCHGKGCQELSLHNLNRGQFLCDAMHTYKDHECVRNIRAIMEDMIKESLARRKIKLLEEHAATKEEIDGYLERVSNMEDFQKLSEKEKQGFLAFFRDQPTPTDTVKKVFYDSEDDGEEEEDDDDDASTISPEEEKEEEEEETEEEKDSPVNVPEDSPGSTVVPEEEAVTQEDSPGSEEDAVVSEDSPVNVPEEDAVVQEDPEDSPVNVPDEDAVVSPGSTVVDQPTQKRKAKKMLGGGGRSCYKNIKDDDVIFNKVFPKMIQHLSSLPMSLGLTARQVVRGMDGTPNWKDRVFASQVKSAKTGGGVLWNTKVEEALKNKDNESWWRQLHTPYLEGLKQELEKKTTTCEEGDGESCEPYATMLERVQELLVKKAISKDKQAVDELLEEEEELLTGMLEPLQRQGKNQEHIHKELEDTRTDLKEKKEELQQVVSEIAFYESSMQTENDAGEIQELKSLLEEARQDERDLQKEVEFLKRQEADLESKKAHSVTAVLAKQASEKIKDLTGIDVTGQLGLFQKNLSDALDERIAENTGVIMTLYLKSIVALRRSVRNMVEQLMPKEAREKHKQNKLWNQQREWFGEQGFFSKKGVVNAALSTILVTTHSSALFAIDAFYFIAKNQYLMTALLLALKTVKQKMCRQIQLFVMTAEVDTQQITTQEIATQLLRQFRLYGPTTMIPKGQEVIRNGLEATKLMLNMMELQKVPFVGSALNSVTFLIIVCANDAFEEMCAANFLMTTATNLIDTLDWFHCFKEPFSEKLNQSWWGTLDTYSLWDMDTYAVQCTAKLSDQSYEMKTSTDPMKYKDGQGQDTPFQIQTRCWPPTPALVEQLVKKENRHSYWYKEQQEKDNNIKYGGFGGGVGGVGPAASKFPLITFQFTISGNAFSQYKTAFEQTSKSGGLFIEATKRNLDVLYILLADKVLEVENIQPPKLHFPIGHWTKYGARNARDKAAGKLLTETYKNDPGAPDPFDFYTMLPTNKDQRNIFDVHMSNLRGKSANEQRDRELCKKYIHHYDPTKHGGKVFTMNHKTVAFVDSKYRFKTEEEETQPQPQAQPHNDEKKGGKTFSWSRSSSSSHNNNNVTRKIIL